ncbi:MAG TPA: 23S rRNA (guanosine(2251)-2'-O)-methyltransferase RlmB [Syntrophomonas sp.]|jgi:23S rRNA (guanosine2251-2'-O)-methyltransferase|nr:23S rRNA (guanosine(2251)-2'-O)-methyltransferase RlmB [Syntrophomonas sp.]
MSEILVGINSIMEALKGRRKIHKIYVQEGRQGKRITDLLGLAQVKGVFVQTVEKRRLDHMYTLGNHQGIIAAVDQYPYASVDDMLNLAGDKGQQPLLLVLDGIEDARNLGAVIRTAECAGVHGIIIPRHNSAEINEYAVRSSAGALEHMLIARETNLVNTLKDLKTRGMWVVGAEAHADAYYYQADIPLPAVVVTGGEGKGIRRLVREQCDLLLKIPMFGVINSLNASVAAALILYEIVRQQQRSGKPGSPNPIN